MILGQLIRRGCLRAASPLAAALGVMVVAAAGAMCMGGPPAGRLVGERGPVLEERAATTGKLIEAPWARPDSWNEAWVRSPAGPNTGSAQAEDAVLDLQPGQGYRTGLVLDLPGRPLTPGNAGVWSERPDGSRVWRMAVTSPGAQALAIHAARLDMPSGARLLVSGSAADLPADLYQGRGPGGKGFLFAKPTPGDTLYVEYVEPKGAGRATIEFDTLTHLYRGFARGAGHSSLVDRDVMYPCHVDVSCRAADAVARDAVGRMYYQRGGSAHVCTGALLNDGDPNSAVGWFLTDSLCIGDQSDADSLTVYWFYQTATCGGAVPDLFTVPSTSGATLISTSGLGGGVGGFSHAFLRLNDDACYGQGLAGWTTEPLSDFGSPVYTISHPQGEYKRYAAGTTTFVSPECDQLELGNFARVDWNGGEGFTEGGSFGAPLFDESWLVRGQLYYWCLYDGEALGCGSGNVSNFEFGRMSGPGGTVPFVTQLNEVQPDDWYEPNDTPADAAQLNVGVENLRLTDFDDYFRVFTPGGTTTFSIRGWADGVYDVARLRLYGLSGNLHNSAYLVQGPGLDETQANLTQSLPEGTYVLRVSRLRGRGGAYTLTIPQDCRDWRAVRTVASPIGRDLAAVAYDGTDQQTLFSCGNNGSATAETWGWNGTAWTLRSDHDLVPCFGAAMAYDTVNHRTVMFGGHTGGALINTTALRSNGAWGASRVIPGSPSPRWLHGMTYDSVEHVTVLYGGSTDSGLSGELWEFDGTNWDRRSDSGPAPRTHAAIAYDAGLQRVVMYGGSTASGPSSETWEWSTRARTWTSTNGQSPGPREHAGLVYDAARGVVVMYGGYDGTRTLSDTWEYDGAWHNKMIAGPRARTNQQLAYDPVRQRVVLFGGGVGDGTHLGDTWEYDGVFWKPVAGAQAPSGRGDFAMAAIPTRRLVVVHGGTSTGFAATDETWVRSDTAWGRLAPVTGGPPRFAQACAFDSARGRMVVFGGLSADGSGSNDTWEFDGDAWRLVDSGPAGTNRPGPLSGARMAFDSHLGRCYLYGGQTYPGSVTTSNAWSWNGTAWTPLGPQAPGARRYASLAYDSARDRMVVFGGSNGSSNVDTLVTWELAAGTWRPVVAQESPPPRRGAAMAYDAARSRTVLFGGYDDAIPARLGETWEWDGGRWVFDDSLTPQPASRNDHAMVYESWAGRTAMFGGQGADGNLNDTQLYSGGQQVEIVGTAFPASVRYGTSLVLGVTFRNPAQGSSRLEWQRNWYDATGEYFLSEPLSESGHFSGVHSATLVVHGLTPADATMRLASGVTLFAEYRFYAFNACGYNGEARYVFPAPPFCAADINRSGVVSVQDIFDFLACYFTGCVDADFNGSGTTSVQDLFDFLTAYFTPCG